MGALNSQILAEGAGLTTGDDKMVTRLSRPTGAPQGPSGGAPAGGSGWGGTREGATTADGAPQQETAREPERQAPAGWGGVAGADGNQEQRERIQDRIAPQPDRANAAASAFTGRVGEAMGEVANTDYGAVGDQKQEVPAEQTRQPAAGGWGGATQQQPAPFEGGAEQTTAPKATRSRAAKAPAENAEVSLIAARAAVLAAVIASAPDATIEDVVEMTRDLMRFVVEG